MENCSNTQLMHKAKEEKEVFFRISLIPDFRHFQYKVFSDCSRCDLILSTKESCSD